LNAVNRFCTSDEIWIPDARPIEAEGRSVSRCRARHARVDFNSDFRIGGKAKRAADRPNRSSALVRREIFGVPPPNELDDFALLETLRLTRSISASASEIRRSDALILLNNHIAGANKHRLSQNGMCMYRETGLRARSLLHGTHSGHLAEESFQLARSDNWLARTGTVVSRENFSPTPQFVAHLLQSWICQRHRQLSRNATASSGRLACKFAFCPFR